MFAARSASLGLGLVLLSLFGSCCKKGNTEHEAGSTKTAPRGLTHVVPSAASQRHSALPGPAGPGRSGLPPETSSNQVALSLRNDMGSLHAPQGHLRQQGPGARWSMGQALVSQRCAAVGCVRRRNAHPQGRTSSPEERGATAHSGWKQQPRTCRTGKQGQKWPRHKVWSRDSRCEVPPQQWADSSWGPQGSSSCGTVPPYLRELGKAGRQNWSAVAIHFFCLGLLSRHWLPPVAASGEKDESEVRTSRAVQKR